MFKRELIDVAAQINLPANIEETGSICVNAKLFAEIVNKAAEDVITFATVDNQLEMRSGASKFKLLTFEASEFPTTNFDTDFNVKVRAAMLKKLIRRTVFAVTRENDRPIFKGVNFIFDEDELTVVATNAQRIAIDKMHAETFGYDAFSAVVPAEALKTLADALSDDIGAVETDHLRFKLAGKIDPAVIVDDNSDFVYVVTLVRI